MRCGSSKRALVLFYALVEKYMNLLTYLKKHGLVNKYEIRKYNTKTNTLLSCESLLDFVTLFFS